MTEQLDVMTEKGKKTGHTLSIDDVHGQELWHQVAHIWIYNSNGEMLLQRRQKHMSSGANQWDLAGGGHISAGEKPISAAIRETEEEIGLKVKPKDLTFVSKTVGISKNSVSGKSHKAFEWNYIAKVDGLDISNMQIDPKETQAVRFFPLEKIEADFRDETLRKNYTARSNELYMQVIKKIKEQLA